jgi:hypothetical protein
VARSSSVLELAWELERVWALGLEPVSVEVWA